MDDEDRIIKGYGFIFIVVLCFDFYIVLCLVCFLFVVWLFRFGYGMDEVMMY